MRFTCSQNVHTVFESLTDGVLEIWTARNQLIKPYKRTGVELYFPINLWMGTADVLVNNYNENDQAMRVEE